MFELDLVGIEAFRFHLLLHFIDFSLFFDSKHFGWSNLPLWYIGMELFEQYIELLRKFGITLLNRLGKRLLELADVGFIMRDTLNDFFVFDF